MNTLCSANSRVTFCFALPIQRSRAHARGHGRGRNRVLVMHASQHRFREHERTRGQSMPGFALLDCRNTLRRIGYARTQRAVRASAIVMSDPLAQNRSQMCLR